MERIAVPRSRPGRLFLVFGIAGLAGCGENPAEQSRRAREAELLAAEAAFAINLRDWPRAEQTLARATELDPGRADLWLSLGSTRVRAGRTTEAREAYLKALRSFERAADAAAAKTDPVPTLEQIRVLARVRAFTEAGGIEQFAADPAFREIALVAGAR
jgi:tetratricopeptide (TPR) repeat protein